MPSHTKLFNLYDIIRRFYSPHELYLTGSDLNRKLQDHTYSYGTAQCSDCDRFLFFYSDNRQVRKYRIIPTYPACQIGMKIIKNHLCVNDNKKGIVGRHAKAYKYPEEL